MTVIKTVAELDALPVDARVTDDDGYQWWKTAQSDWRPMSDTGTSSARLFQLWSPLTLAERPGVHMVRCCAQDCPNTAALQPGSSYLCPSHGDGGCSENTITKGDGS